MVWHSTFIQSGFLSNRKCWIRTTFIGQKSWLDKMLIFFETCSVRTTLICQKSELVRTIVGLEYVNLCRWLRRQFKLHWKNNRQHWSLNFTMSSRLWHPSFYDEQIVFWGIDQLVQLALVWTPSHIVASFHLFLHPRKMEFHCEFPCIHNKNKSIITLNRG